MKNPQDATLANVRAANKWLLKLIERIRRLEKRVKKLEKKV